MQERAAASQSSTSQSSKVANSLESGESDIPTGDSLFGSVVTKAAVPNPTDKSIATRGGKQSSNAQIGIKWNELLAVCTTQMITKNDIEMRKLICKCHFDYLSSFATVLFFNFAGLL